MPALLRKLATRPIWWWEKKRPYPIRSRCARLPPIPVTPRGPLLAVLTTVPAFLDALWAAWSWHRFLHEQFQLAIFVDGETSERHRRASQQLFPGVRIHEMSRITEEMCISHPRLAAFITAHPLGRKIALLLHLQKARPVLFTDHDVLVFNAPAEISEPGIQTPLHIQEEEGEGVFDGEMLARAAALGASHAPALNSGVLYIPRGALCLETAEALLSDWKPPMRSWFTEQTVLSVLMRRAGSKPLARERYVVSNRRQFYSEKDVSYAAIAARHFTAPVRHVMYLKGMPYLLRHPSITGGLQ